MDLTENSQARHDDAERRTAQRTADRPKHPTVSLGDLIAPARPAMALSIVLGALGASLSIVPFIALQNMASQWLHDAAQPELFASLSPIAWAIIALVAIVATQLLYLASLGITHVAEARLRYTLRQKLMQALGTMPLGNVASTPHGEIRKIICDDTSAIHTLVAHVPGDFTTALASILAGSIYLFIVDWKLMCALLGVWIAVALIVMPMMSGLGSLTEDFGVAQTRLAAETVDMIEGIKEIKNFQATDASRTRFNDARDQFSQLSYLWVSQSGKPISFMGAVLKPSSVLATVAPLAVLFVSMGWTPLSSTLPFFLVALGMPDGLMTFVALTQHMYTSHQAARSTAQLLSIPPMPEGSVGVETAVDDKPTQGVVELCNVSFSYGDSYSDGDSDGYSEDNTTTDKAANDVIHDISFTAQPGTVTALVGPSGGGKSTLAKLIARFYDVREGQVLIDGVDVRDTTFEWLLSRVSIVLQDVALSDDTVGANIALGRPHATRAEIEEAARAACIHERIMRLPHGYDTVLGEDGGHLSGGERQRITIARTYLQNTPILVLDEATAQADATSEQEIHEALSRLAVGRTVIIIAHRLSTIVDADRILVIDDGRVAEQGTHDELVALGGQYAALWETQNVRLDDDGGPVAAETNADTTLEGGQR